MKLYKQTDTLGMGTGTVSRLYPKAIPLPDVSATLAQWDSIEKITKRWHKVLSVRKAFGSDDALIVRVQGEQGTEITLGVEPDGYTHS